MASKRPFRFGVAAAAAESRQDWVEQARKAEQLGYSTFLVPDHFVNPFEPFVALSIAAEATTTLRVGTFVCANDFRHPALLAKEAATLDLLSGGRFELGVGAGWHGGDYEQTGIPFDPPGVRVGRLEEAVQIMKALYGEEPVTFEGEHYRITGLQGQPTPVQKPRPPLLIAGGGKRMLSMAAREADIVALLFQTRADGSGADPSTSSAEATDRKLDWVREAAGGRFEDLEINTLVYWAVTTDDRKAAAEEVLANTTRPGFTVELLLETPHALFGSEDGIVEQLEMWRERWGISYIAVVDNLMESFAPYVQRLSGR